MMQPPSIILGIDPSLRGTGYGMIQCLPNGKFRSLAFGVISNASDLSLGGCLLAIHEKLGELIETHRPDCAAIERTIYVQSRSVAITLGCARGAAIVAVSRHGLELFEYAPKQIKLAATGRGGARKEQIAFMIRAILQLDTTPSNDAADALAIALTHAQSWKSQKLLSENNGKSFRH